MNQRPAQCQRVGQIAVTIADVNADGIQDVLLAPSESATGQLAWYESEAPSGAGTWRKHVIDSTVSFIHTFKTGDVDNDGDLDIITAEMHQTGNPAEVSVYFNRGDGSVWTQEVVATTGSHPKSPPLCTRILQPCTLAGSFDPQPYTTAIRK